VLGDWDTVDVVPGGVQIQTPGGCITEQVETDLRNGFDLAWQQISELPGRHRIVQFGGVAVDGSLQECREPLESLLSGRPGERSWGDRAGPVGDEGVEHTVVAVKAPAAQLQSGLLQIGHLGVVELARCAEPFDDQLRK